MPIRDKILSVGKRRHEKVFENIIIRKCLAAVGVTIITDKGIKALNI